MKRMKRIKRIKSKIIFLNEKQKKTTSKYESMLEIGNII